MNRDLENAKIQGKLDLNPQEATKNSVLRLTLLASCSPGRSMSMRLAMITREKAVNLNKFQEVVDLSIS
jgi:hypothetical protein